MTGRSLERWRLCPLVASPRLGLPNSSRTTTSCAMLTDNSLLRFIMRRSRDGDRRLDVYAQAEQDQSRHDERSSDHRDERPYMGVRQPRIVNRVFVRSIHELCFCTFPDDFALT